MAEFIAQLCPALPASRQAIWAQLPSPVGLQFVAAAPQYAWRWFEENRNLKVW
jgi:hypothetical protein